MTSVRKTKITALLALLLITVACKTTSSDTSFSAFNDGGNVALLMSASGHTPGYSGLFVSDMSYLNSIISDPTSNFGFHSTMYQDVSYWGMSQQITAAAQQVGPNGTLLLFITAHGAPNGAIETQGAGYGVFTYESIRQALYQSGNRFRRLVLFVSSCYSGMWMHTVYQDPNIFDELLVVTSVNPNQLSYIGNATQAMLNTFAYHKHTPGLTVGQFLATAQSYHPSLMFLASHQSVYTSQFVNPESAAVPEPAVSDDTPPTIRAVLVDHDQSQTEVSADQDILILYANRKTKGLRVKSPVNGDWVKPEVDYQAQSGWPEIKAVVVSKEWRNHKKIDVGVDLEGMAYHLEVELTDKTAE
jgi:hypothetical protein